MPSRDTKLGKLTIPAATILLLGTGIFTGAAFSSRLPGWYRMLFLGVAVAMVLCAVVLVLRTFSLERRLSIAPAAVDLGNRVSHEPMEDLPELASGLAQEIRNSLAGLTGVVEVLGRDLPASSDGREAMDQAQRYIRHIDQALADFRAQVEARAPKPEQAARGSRPGEQS